MSDRADMAGSSEACVHNSIDERLLIRTLRSLEDMHQRQVLANEALLRELEDLRGRSREVENVLRQPWWRRLFAKPLRDDPLRGIAVSGPMSEASWLLRRGPNEISTLPVLGFTAEARLVSRYGGTQFEQDRNGLPWFLVPVVFGSWRTDAEKRNLTPSAVRSDPLVDIIAHESQGFVREGLGVRDLIELPLSENDEYEGVTASVVVFWLIDPEAGLRTLRELLADIGVRADAMDEGVAPALMWSRVRPRRPEPGEMRDMYYSPWEIEPLAELQPGEVEAVLRDGDFRGCSSELLDAIAALESQFVDLDVEAFLRSRRNKPG